MPEIHESKEVKVEKVMEAKLEEEEKTDQPEKKMEEEEEEEDEWLDVLSTGDLKKKVQLYCAFTMK